MFSARSVNDDDDDDDDRGTNSSDRGTNSSERIQLSYYHTIIIIITSL
jgi:hypothetical protein